MNGTRIEMPDDRHPSDEQLFDLASGTLRRGEAQAVQAHVRSCARCAQLVQAGTAAVANAPAAAERLPAHHAARLHEAIDAEWERRVHSRAAQARQELPTWRRYLNIGLAFGVLALGVGVVVPIVRDDVAPQGGASAGGESFENTQVEPHANSDSGVPATAGEAAPQRAEDLAAGGAGGAQPTSAGSDADARTPKSGGAASATDTAAPPTSDSAGALVVPQDPTTGDRTCLLQIAGTSFAVTGELVLEGDRLTAGPIRSIAIVCNERDYAVPNESVVAPGTPLR